MERLAVFVDVQNIYYTTRQAFNRQFNYRALWKRLSEQGHITLARAYAIHRGDAQQLKFQNALKHIGFDVRLKPYIQRSDGSAKGDWDVGITIDVMEFAPDVDRVVLLSGDGDFDLLLAKIHQRYGTTTEVIAAEALSADSLKKSCQHFTPIDTALLL